MKQRKKISKYLLILIFVLDFSIFSTLIYLTYKIGQEFSFSFPATSDDAISDTTANNDTPPANYRDLINTPDQTVKVGSWFYCPILMYHHIAAKTPQESYYVSPSTFDAQLAWLRDNDYTVIPIDEFYDVAKNGGKIPVNPVVITFDDGNIDLYTNAFPILKKYGYPATVFLKINNIGEGKGGLTWKMIKEMSKAGMTVGSHSVNHDDMTKLEEQIIDQELSESKKTLEDNLGIKVKYFAYPGGAFDSNIVTKTEKAGYLAAFSTKHKVYQRFSNTTDYFNIPRIHIDDELPSFIDFVNGLDY